VNLGVCWSSCRRKSILAIKQNILVDLIALEVFIVLDTVNTASCCVRRKRLTILFSWANLIFLNAIHQLRPYHLPSSVGIRRLLRRTIVLQVLPQSLRVNQLHISKRVSIGPCALHRHFKYLYLYSSALSSIYPCALQRHKSSQSAVSHLHSPHHWHYYYFDGYPPAMSLLQLNHVYVVCTAVPMVFIPYNLNIMLLSNLFQVPAWAHSYWPKDMSRTARAAASFHPHLSQARHLVLFLSTPIIYRTKHHSRMIAIGVSNATFNGGIKINLVSLIVGDAN